MREVPFIMVVMHQVGRFPLQSIIGLWADLFAYAISQKLFPQNEAC